jgi:histidyl-tRNA synthetase
VTLRPEATASICRAYIQHKLYTQDPVQKFYMIGPMFRRERPQKGRYRQFYQIDAEIFGVQSGLVDAQLIYLLVTLCRRLKLQDVEAHLNSLGCPRCRPQFRAALSGFVLSVSDRLCPDCIRRRDRNPLRVLDCKVPSCREALTGAPSILDHLCEDCRSDFDQVMAALSRLGVAYVIDRQLVRGLDYYTRTAFEIQTTSLGAQSAVAGGGRYDNLVKELGGPDIPATGFAVGFDRLAELAALNIRVPVQKPNLFVAALGAESQALAFEWICRLGMEGVRAEMDFSDKSLKSQMKRADRLGAGYTMILGDNELKEKTAILRNMESKEQIPVPLENIIQTIKDVICQ